MLLHSPWNKSLNEERTQPNIMLRTNSRMSHKIHLKDINLHHTLDPLLVEFVYTITKNAYLITTQIKILDRTHKL